MAPKSYYVTSGEHEEGPHTLAELRTALLEGKTTESSLIRAEDETEKRLLSEVLRPISDGERAPRTVKRRKKARDDGSGDSSAEVADRVSSAKPGAEARDLAISLLRKKKPAVEVEAALVASGVQPEAAKVLLYELIRLRQPMASEQLMEEGERLSDAWKVAIYGSILVPCLGQPFIVIVTSYMYYLWRRDHPKKAAEINRHGWIASFLGGALFFVLILFFSCLPSRR